MRATNPSVVALLPVTSILVIGSWLLGAGTLTDIALALFVGMLVGAISSIFVGAPLLAILEGRRPAIASHDAKILKARSLKSAKSADEGNAKPEERSARVLAVKPGVRLPNSAQPKRKKRSR